MNEPRNDRVRCEPCRVAGKLNESLRRARIGGQVAGGAR